MEGDMKRQEIQTALGLKHEDHFRETYIVPALKAGVVEMTIPEKPRSSKRRYRITSKGKEIQRKLTFRM
jgi:predicted transcriptional regulator